MRARFTVLLGFAALAACVEHAPPPPHELPPPPAPLLVAAPSGEDSSGGSPGEGTTLPRPQPTGDRERDALELGFWGCRVMGARLMPTMSGRAWLRATLGPGGEVVDAVALRVEDLPRPVVQCLLDRLARAHFDPRGGEGSTLDLPVDFTRAPERPTRTLGTAAPTQSL
jgi:hypothetical protein